jgi:hypothetical protein
MEADDQRVRLRVSPLAYLAGIVAGVLLLTMIGLLIAQLAVLQDSRGHIEAQDHKISSLQAQAEPLLRESRPVVRQTERLLRRAPSVLGPAGRSLDSLADAAGTIPRLAAGADLLLGESIPLLQALNASDAPGAIAALGRLADDLAANDRTVRLVDSANRTLDEIARLRLVARTSEALPRLDRRVRELLRLQRRTLRRRRSLRERARRRPRRGRQTGALSQNTTSWRAAKWSTGSESRPRPICRPIAFLANVASARCSGHGGWWISPRRMRRRSSSV